MASWSREYVDKHLKPRLPAMLDEHAGRSDARLDRDPAPGEVNRLVREAKTAFFERFPQWQVQKLLKRYAKRTADHNRVQLGKQVKAAVGIDLGSIIDKGLNKVVDDFTAANVALISTIPEQYLSQVEQTVLNGLRSGQRAGELAKDIEERYEVTKDRAYRIARDQIGKLTGDLNKVRQTNLGIDRFAWRGMNDERERDWHRQREGKVYTWAEGVPEDEQEDGAGDAAFPGEAIECRCYAEPVFDDDDELESDEDR